MDEINIAYVLIAKAFRLYYSKFVLFSMLGFVLMIMSLLQFLTVGTNSTPIFFVSLIANIIVSYVVYLAMLRVALSPARATLKDVLFGIEKYIVPAAWVSGIIILATFGGVALFVIPGIIVSIFLNFSIVSVIGEHLQKTDAVIYSWRLVEGRWWRVFSRILIAGIVLGAATVIVISIITAGIAGNTHASSLAQTFIYEAIDGFFTLPLALSFICVLYEDLKRVSVPKKALQEKSIMKILAILSIVGVMALFAGLLFSSNSVARIVPEVVTVTHAPASVFSAF